MLLLKSNNNQEGTKPVILRIMEGTKLVILRIMEGTPPLRGVPYPTL